MVKQVLSITYSSKFLNQNYFHTCFSLASKNNAEDPNHDTLYVVHAGEGLPNMDFHDAMDLIQFFFSILRMLLVTSSMQKQMIMTILNHVVKTKIVICLIYVKIFLWKKIVRKNQVRKQLISSVALSNLLIFINMLLVGSRLSKTLLHYFTQHFKSVKSLRLHYHFCNN